MIDGRIIGAAGRRISRRGRFLATKERIERKGHNDPKGRVHEMKHATNVGEEFSTDVYHALAWPSHGSGSFLFVMFFSVALCLTSYAKLPVQI